MRISHDKDSGALYIKLREGQYDHTEDFSEQADVYVDVDAEGNVLGLEALSFDDLAMAVEEREGELEIPEVWPGSSDLNVQSVKGAFQALGSQEQEVLRLRFDEGLSRSAVAERLRIAVADAYRIERSAFSEMRRMLKADGTGEPSLEALLAAL